MTAPHTHQKGSDEKRSREMYQPSVRLDHLELCWCRPPWDSHSQRLPPAHRQAPARSAREHPGDPRQGVFTAALSSLGTAPGPRQHSADAAVLSWSAAWPGRKEARSARSSVNGSHRQGQAGEVRHKCLQSSRHMKFKSSQDWPELLEVRMEAPPGKGA